MYAEGSHFKGAPSVVRSEFGAVALQITAYSQNLRKYESSNQTSGIRGTLGDRPCGRPGILARIMEGIAIGALIKAHITHFERGQLAGIIEFQCGIYFISIGSN